MKGILLQEMKLDQQYNGANFVTRGRRIATGNDVRVGVMGTRALSVKQL